MLTDKCFAHKKPHEHDCCNQPFHTLLRLPTRRCKSGSNWSKEKCGQSPLYKLRNCVAFWSLLGGASKAGNRMEAVESTATPQRVRFSSTKEISPLAVYPRVCWRTLLYVNHV